MFQEAMLFTDHAFVPKFERVQSGDNGQHCFNNMGLVRTLVVSFVGLEDQLRRVCWQVFAPLHMNAGQGFNRRADRKPLDVATT